MFRIRHFYLLLVFSPIFEEFLFHRDKIRNPAPFQRSPCPFKYFTIAISLSSNSFILGDSWDTLISVSSTSFERLSEAGPSWSTFWDFEKMKIFVYFTFNISPTFYKTLINKKLMQNVVFTIPCYWHRFVWRKGYNQGHIFSITSIDQFLRTL